VAHDLLFFFKGVNTVTVAIDVARLLLLPKISEFLGLMERAKLLKNYIYKGVILHVEREKVEKITNYVVSYQTYLFWNNFLTLEVHLLWDGGSIFLDVILQQIVANLFYPSRITTPTPKKQWRFFVWKAKQ